MCFSWLVKNKIMADTPYRVFDAELSAAYSLVSYKPTWVNVTKRLLEVLELRTTLHLYHRDVNIKDINTFSSATDSFTDVVPRDKCVMSELEKYKIDETSTLAAVINAHLYRKYFIHDRAYSPPFIGFGNGNNMLKTIKDPVFFTDPNDKGRVDRFYKMSESDWNALTKEEVQAFMKNEGPAVSLHFNKHTKPIESIVLWRSDQDGLNYNREALQRKITQHVAQQYPELTFHQGDCTDDIVAQMLEGPKDTVVEATPTQFLITPSTKRLM